MQGKSDGKIELIHVKNDEKDKFKQNARDAFLKGLAEAFPSYENPEKIAPIPSNEDFDESLYSENIHIYWIYIQKVNVGGVILEIDSIKGENNVDILFINATAQGLGIGTKVWSEIENYFPNTSIWKLSTPYFEKRNIKFYLENCNFYITGMHTHSFCIDSINKEFDFFDFEKVMS